MMRLYQTIHTDHEVCPSDTVKESTGLARFALACADTSAGSGHRRCCAKGALPACCSVMHRTACALLHSLRMLLALIIKWVAHFIRPNQGFFMCSV